MKKAKIIATIGPASESLVQLKNLIEAGMDVARLNFAHGNHDRYRDIIEKIRYLSSRNQRPVAILQDISGIKIRTGPLDNHHPVSLTRGQRITITTEPISGSNKLISVNYSHLPLDLTPGAPLLPPIPPPHSYHRKGCYFIDDFTIPSKSSISILQGI